MLVSQQLLLAATQMPVKRSALRYQPCQWTTYWRLRSIAGVPGGYSSQYNCKVHNLPQNIQSKSAHLHNHKYPKLFLLGQAHPHVEVKTSRLQGMSLPQLAGNLRYEIFCWSPFEKKRKCLNLIIVKVSSDFGKAWGCDEARGSQLRCFKSNADSTRHHGMARSDCLQKSPKKEEYAMNTALRFSTKQADCYLSAAGVLSPGHTPALISQPQRRRRRVEGPLISAFARFQAS